MMDSPSSRQARRFAAAAALLALAFVVGNALRGRAPVDVQTFEEPTRPSPAASGAAPGAAVAAASEKPGYLRPLDAADVPLPGHERRARADARDARDAQAPAAAIAQIGPAAVFGAPNFPSGGNTPTASSLSLVKLPEEEKPAPHIDGAPSNGTGKASRPPGESGMAGLSAAEAAAANLINGARGQLKGVSPGTNPLTPGAVASALRSQMAQDHKTEASIREAVSNLGSGASDEEKKTAVAAALAAAGEPAEPADVDAALAKASRPPRPQASAAATEDAIRQMSANIPSPQRLEQLAKLAMEPPPGPTAPPPKGGVEAYVKYREAFDRDEKEFGLKPSQVVPFPAIESSNGANTGKFPTRDILLSIQSSGNFSPSQRRQAARDSAAMGELIRDGDLGGRKAEQIYGSNMGAIGITQFLPSTWAAYGRSMNGGPRDPWNFGDAVYSTGNYLYHSGSQKSYEGAVLTYNHSAKYLHDILQYGANVEPGIRAVQQAAASPLPAQAAAVPPK